MHPFFAYKKAAEHADRSSSSKRNESVKNPEHHRPTHQAKNMEGHQGRNL